MSLLPEPAAEHVARCESCQRLIRTPAALRLGRGPKCEAKRNPHRLRLRVPKQRGPAQPGPDLLDQLNEEEPEEPDDQCDGFDR